MEGGSTHRELLSGNEAMARGAWEAGASIGVGYPGTPSTETMEVFSSFPDVYAEWCPNEKVALEVGVGASVAGRRVLVTMKHVGVNVAADPLYTAAYTGVGGGLVILAADDPGMHSSQNEQDSRFHAMGARVPMLDPADSAEARIFARDAFELSERFDLPIMLRSTVRVSHTKSPIEVGERVEAERPAYVKDMAKWVMMPAFAKPRRIDLDKRIEQVREFVEGCPYNVVERRSAEIGIICAGATYQHVREALPEASVLKIGVSWPLPEKMLRAFAKTVEHLYVVEEGSDYLSGQVRSLGVELEDAGLPGYGELTPAMIARALGGKAAQSVLGPEEVPGRPPALCPGCPHRLVFYELSRMRAIVTGDIGCYTLAALPPLSGMDTCLCMGASISMAHGFELGMGEQKHRPVVSVIGDSTFTHSGITSLLNTVYNCGTGTVCILDNRTTGMTGHQGNPVNGVTLQKRPTRELDLLLLVKALGVEDVHRVNAMDDKAVRSALSAAVKNDDLSVLIFESPCVLITKERSPAYEVKSDCRACGICSRIGCPAIVCDPVTAKASVEATQCVGCSQCAQVCPHDCFVIAEGGVHV